jgi:hypothetical protein
VDSGQPTVSRSIAKGVLSDTLESELRTQRALVDALARVKKIGEDLAMCVKSFEHEQTSTIRALSLALWQPSDHMRSGPIDFHVRILIIRVKC